MLAVDVFLEMAVDECVGDVELMCWLVVGGDEGEDGAYGGRLDYRRKCLAEVDAGSLMEASDNPTGFIPLERPVGVELVFEDPFPGDDASAGWTWNESPCLVGL